MDEVERVGALAVDGKQDEKSLPVRTWSEPRSFCQGAAIKVETQRPVHKKPRPLLAIRGLPKGIEPTVGRSHTSFEAGTTAPWN
jgi:hypothetical protein